MLSSLSPSLSRGASQTVLQPRAAPIDTKEAHHTAPNNLRQSRSRLRVPRATRRHLQRVAAWINSPALTAKPQARTAPPCVRYPEPGFPFHFPPPPSGIPRGACARTGRRVCLRQVSGRHITSIFSRGPSNPAQGSLQFPLQFQVLYQSGFRSRTTPACLDSHRHHQSYLGRHTPRPGQGL